MTTKKLSKKTDALTLRLDPRVKFLIEMSSRVGHQSITGVIESAVRVHAHHRKVSLCGKEASLSVAGELIWAPEESERIVNMMFYAPALLSHEELCIKSVIEASDEIFYNMHYVQPANYDYRDRYYKDRKGSFFQDAEGDLYFVTPRVRIIKLAWAFIKARAEELAEKGTFEPFTEEEIEILIGRPLDTVAPDIKVPKGEVDVSEKISYKGEDKELDDLLSNVTGKS
jgi:hypothetical protein